MSTALDRTYLELKNECDRWGIQVPTGERVIVWRDLAINIEFGTSRVVCRRKLKKLIKAAEKEHFNKTQSKLL